MRRGVVVWLGCALLLAGVAAAEARDAHELNADELRYEMDRNSTLKGYVGRNGPPDLAETHFLADRPPWDEYEVTLYYLSLRKEIAFARASILGRPEIHTIRYERALTDEQMAALAARARPAVQTARVAPASASAAGRLGPAERAEASADRAEAAASRVEAAAETTERAADRAEAIVAKMETPPPRPAAKSAAKKE